MKTSVSLPSLLSQSKLFASQNQLEATKREFKERYSKDRGESDDKPTRSLIQFQEKGEGFTSFKNINSARTEQILSSFRSMRSPSTHLGVSMKAQILFNKQQYGRIREYCQERRSKQRQLAVARLAKLQPLPMPREVKKIDRNKKKIRITTGIRTEINWGVYENNRICWKPYYDFDAMGVRVDSRVYFIGGRKNEKLCYYERVEDTWIEEEVIEGLKPFGESEGTVISKDQVVFFGGSRFFVMGESQPFNSLTFIYLMQKKARVVPFEQKKVASRCFHAQCKYGDYLIVSGGIDRKHKLLNNFMAYHLGKKYWVELTIADRPEKLNQGFAKHKMMPVFHPRRKYHIYEEEEIIASEQERSLITKEGIYMFGGEDANVELSNKLYLLEMGKPSIEVVQLEPKGTPPEKRKNFDWVRVRQFIFIQGGRNDERRPWVLNSLEVLDLKALNWLEVKGEKPSMRHSHVLFAREEEIIILGGKNVDGLCKQVFPMRFEQLHGYL